ncbi:hypothetical protein F5Y13DRAFT_70795 [Hypoxylon sp. FL1857]|nr:hypothetical protein F5Y13DRAFT_70795 [Hypoxylon sp. FL1857]
MKSTSAQVSDRPEKDVQATEPSPGEAPTSQPYHAGDVARAISFGIGPSYTSQWAISLVERIESVAREWPDRPTVRSGDNECVTYATLVSRSIHTATYLRANGMKKGSRIAVLQEATTDWVVSILSIMRIGAVYIPLDVANPPERLSHILQDCQADILLIDEGTTVSSVWLGGLGIKIVKFSSLASESQAPDTPTAVSDDDPAVVFYTSGSTGVPKGIVLKHVGLRNWIEWISHMLPASDDEVVLQQSPLGYDNSFTEVFAALCYGGCVYLLPRHLRGDAYAISELMSSAKITSTFATPSEYFSWLKYGSRDSIQRSPWRRAICFGEPLEGSLLDNFAALGKPELRFWNIYGPTEISFIATAMEIPLRPETNGSVERRTYSAGYTLPNYTVYVLDKELQPVPPGVQGEIYIGGPGVAIGYLGKTTLTKERFLPDLFASDELRSRGWAMMHRSGDLGHWEWDGTLFIEGRISGDTQTKIRGQRVDLREVEIALVNASHGLVSEAVVTPRCTAVRGSEVLVAHVKLDPAYDRDDREERLRDLVSALSLPRHMCPAAIVPLERLPRTSSGKLDRKGAAQLAIPERALSDNGSSISLDNTEAVLAEIWADIIPRDIARLHRITAGADFFHVGGTSISLLGLRERIHSAFGVNLTLVQLFESSILGEMARRVENKETSGVQVDWESETELSPSILAMRVTDFSDEKGPLNDIVLTGATGLLGKAFLSALTDSPDIGRIHCIGIRNVDRNRRLLGHPKVILYGGDLTLPRFGLSRGEATAIFSKASRIIHNGADVSHLKTFQSLREVNLQATKQLVEMSLPRRIPIHYISSAAVCELTSLDAYPELSVSAYSPATDESDGYTASKWASERYLEKVHAYCGWPIWIHRPTNVLREHDPELDLMQNMLRYSRALRAVPSEKWRGVLNLVSRGSVAKSILREMRESYSGAICYVHEKGAVDIRLDDIGSFVEADGGGKVERLSPEMWAARARARGLDEFQAAFFENLARKGTVRYPQLLKGRAVAVGC